MTGFSRSYVWALAAVLGAVMVVAGLAGESHTHALGLLGLLAVATWLAWGNGARRALVGGLYLLAPLDVALPDTGWADGPWAEGVLGNAVPLVLVPLAAWWLARAAFIERRAPPFGRVDLLFAGLALAAWLRAMATPTGAHGLALAGACAFALLAACVVSHAIAAPADLRFVVHAAGWGVFVEVLRYAARGSDAMAGAPAIAVTMPAAFLSMATLVVPVTVALVLPGRRRVSPRMWGSALAVGFTTLALVVLASSPAALVACLGGAAVSASAWAAWRWRRASGPWQDWEDPGLVALAAGFAGALSGHAIFLALDGPHADGRLVLPFLVAGTARALWAMERRRRAAEAAWLAKVSRESAAPAMAAAAVDVAGVRVAIHAEPIGHAGVPSSFAGNDAAP
jgi:hypothetical protein